MHALSLSPSFHSLRQEWVYEVSGLLGLWQKSDNGVTACNWSNTILKCPNSGWHAMANHNLSTTTTPNWAWSYPGGSLDGNTFLNAKTPWYTERDRLHYTEKTLCEQVYHLPPQFLQLHRFFNIFSAHVPSILCYEFCLLHNVAGTMESLKSTTSPTSFTLTSILVALRHLNLIFSTWQPSWTCTAALKLTCKLQQPPACFYHTASQILSSIFSSFISLVTAARGSWSKICILFKIITLFDLKRHFPLLELYSHWWESREFNLSCVHCTYPKGSSPRSALHQGKWNHGAGPMGLVQNKDALSSIIIWTPYSFRF